MKAVEHSIHAGERALAALAPAEALTWFQRAIDVLNQTPESDLGQRCDALIGLGDAQRQVGNPDYSEALLEASDLARELGDGTRMARAAEANTRGFTSVVGQVDQRRVEALEAALEVCEEDRQRSSLLSLLAVELSYSVLDRRLNLSGEAVRLARKSGDRHALAWALARRQIAIAAPETLTERLAEAEEVIALADELDDTMLRYWAAVWRGMDALETGDLETAARGRKVQEEITEETGQPMFRWVDTYAPALLACLAGDFELAEELTNESARLGSEAGQPDVLAIYAAQIHAIRYEQGRLEEIIEIQEQVVEEAPLVEAYSSALALSYCELGEAEKAREVLARFAANRFEITPTLSTKTGLGFLAEAAARLGDRDAAGLLYERLLPWRDQLSYTGVTLFGPVERYLGLAATCLGNHDAAEEHFQRSTEICERIEAPTWLARTRHERALMLLDRAGPEIARPPRSCSRRPSRLRSPTVAVRSSGGCGGRSSSPPTPRPTSDAREGSAQLQDPDQPPRLLRSRLIDTGLDPECRPGGEECLGLHTRNPEAEIDRADLLRDSNLPQQPQTALSARPRSFQDDREAGAGDRRRQPDRNSTGPGNPALDTPRNGHVRGALRLDDERRRGAGGAALAGGRDQGQFVSADSSVSGNLDDRFARGRRGAACRRVGRAAGEGAVGEAELGIRQARGDTEFEFGELRGGAREVEHERQFDLGARDDCRGGRWPDLQVGDAQRRFATRFGKAADGRPRVRFLFFAIDRAGGGEFRKDIAPTHDHGHLERAAERTAARSRREADARFDRPGVFLGARFGNRARAVAGEFEARGWAEPSPV